MIYNTIKQLHAYSESRYYWMLLIASCLIMLSLALVFQYAFDEAPCLMCIQVRLWLSLLMVVSVIALLSIRIRLINRLSHLLVVLITLAFVERSYMLLGTERGFVLSDCGFDLGLPAWLALDQWFPFIYGVETLCGYTPEIIFGITMAEALMVISSLLLVLSSSMLVMTLLADRE